jgi:phosphomannomutase / phosphoglucomutase
MKINQHIFREYDIRGTVDVDLSEEFAYQLGRAYALLAKENNKNDIAIGFDCRLTSPIYAQALARGMSDESVSCRITGMGPTPQLYYALFGRNCGGGIQVTGSHNPPEMNGFKICLGQKTLSGTEIRDLYNRMIELPSQPNKNLTKGAIVEDPLKDEYTAMLIDKSTGHVGKRKFKIVVDAGNGVGGIIGPKILKAIGAEVIELFCEPDGNFPNHHPDPSEVETLHTLMDTVKREKADFGIAFDGDADRIGIVDEKGSVIYGDLLLLLYARDILRTNPSPTVIGDVKCSQRLFDDLKKRGAKGIMWKTGHSLIKAKLRETSAELAGEMSGHMFFNDRYFGYDDALYAALRFAELVSHTDKPVSELLNDLPTAFSSPEIRVDCPEEKKFIIPQKLKEVFAHLDVDTTDGVRVKFKNGWGLVRASNTQPVLVMRFEAETEEALNEYQKILTEEVKKIA